MLSGRAASVKWKLKTVGLSVPLDVPPLSLPPLSLFLSLSFPLTAACSEERGREKAEAEQALSLLALLHLFYMIIKEILTLVRN